MVIYIEAVIGINILIHYFFESITFRILELKKKKLNTMILLFFDSVIVLGCLFFDFNYPILFIIPISLFMFKDNIKKMFLGALIYFFLNIILGGVIGILGVYTNKTYLYIILICFILAFIFEHLKNVVKNRNRSDLYYKIYLKINKEYLKINAFLDTGLKINAYKSVVLINKKYKKEMLSSDSIKISTITSQMVIDLYEVDDFLIKVGDSYIRKDVYVAFVEMSDDSLIGLDLLGGF